MNKHINKKSFVVEHRKITGPKVRVIRFDEHITRKVTPSKDDTKDYMNNYGRSVSGIYSWGK